MSASVFPLRIHAAEALTAEGWRADVCVDVGKDGRILSVTSGADRGDATSVGILLPAPANLHSHAFQRAMAGLTERRGPSGHDSFWTWRALMYRFLDQLTPDQVEAIAALVQMEMLESGYAAVCEFHYLHHRPDGSPYDNVAEMAERICSAAARTGIGLTLLPVLYSQGGCDGRSLGAGQRRFGSTPDAFGALYSASERAIAALPADTGIGVAPHSLRAVSRDGLSYAAALAPGRPLHMHLAEQAAEVEEVSAAYGARPTEWLLDNHSVDARWCLIHCTQMNESETTGLARTGAVAGLCPITESSLGDGIFDGARYLSSGGRFGIGSDSNIRIALSEELRTLEYSQRLRDRARAVLATETASCGRILVECAASGGAAAAGRDSGAIASGRLADFVALDAGALALQGRHRDVALDSWIFAGDDRLVSDVWAAGRHVVQGGRHVGRDRIISNYRKAIAQLRDGL